MSANAAVYKADRKRRKALSTFHKAHDGLCKAEAQLSNAIAEHDENIARIEQLKEETAQSLASTSKLREKLADFVN